MNEDINKLLIELEPEIDKKCAEIRERKSSKNKQLIYILLLIVFLSTPSILILLNISLSYLIGGIIIFLLLIVFVKLPDLLNTNIKGTYYEQKYR